MDTNKRLLGYILKYKKILIILLISSIVLALTNLASASLVKLFFAGASKQDTANLALTIWLEKFGLISSRHSLTSIMTFVAIFFMTIYIIRGVFMYLNQYYVGVMGARLGNELRENMYENVQNLSLSYFHKGKVGDFISRMNSDISIITNSASIIMIVIEAPVMIVAGIIRLLLINWMLTIFVFVCVPIIGFILQKITSKLKKFTEYQQESIGDVNAKVTENLHGIRVIKSFGMENAELDKFKVVNDRSLEMTIRTTKRSALVLPIMEAVGGIAMGLLILIGSMYIIKGYLTFPDLGEYIMIAFMVANAVKSLSKLKATIEQVKAASGRVFELMDIEPEEIETKDPITNANPKGKLEFKNVDFSYDKIDKIIDNVSFEIKPGEVIAIVGPSGGGKSTIIDLIPRFYDIDSGAIEIDDYNIVNYKKEDLRNLIAIVPQETILFSGTIRDNIAYGNPDASFEEVVTAAKNANAKNFIEALPNKYETVLGETGVGLSGGQRQRIAIARALLKDSKIIIFDEATSALDAESESILQEALDNLPDNKTTIIIAHRLSTVKNADRILVIDRGKLVQVDTFENLQKQTGMFSQLYNTQFC